MRAIMIHAPGGLDALRPVERPDPGQPGPGQIRVKVGASSLNYHDLRVCSETDSSFFGRVPLADGAGTVEAVGQGVSRFSPGDRVVSTFLPLWQDGAPSLQHLDLMLGDKADGFACEIFVGSETWFTLAPAGWSDAEAATLTTAGATAWRALVVDGGLKPGATVLTLGTGGVSIFAVQFAKALGARIIVTSSSDEKLARARALGADATINYRSVPDWSAQVLDLTEGIGVDHVLETVGAGTIAQSIAATRPGGHIALIGSLTGHPVEMPVGQAMYRQLRMQGLVVGSRQHQQDMVEAINRFDHMRPVIDRTYPLEQLAEAFRTEQAGGHFGKLCISV